MSRLFDVTLVSIPASLIVLLLSLAAAAAPTSCTFSCPSTDNNGHTLITVPSSTPGPYDGPYSIFDCVYSLPGTPTPPHTCRYYKADGLNALGQATNSDCPTQAVPCLEDVTPKFSAPDKVEVPPWIGQGNDLLYYRENHPSPSAVHS